MDLTKVLADMRSELENLDAAIESLERLQTDAPRRGRPPKVLPPSRNAGGYESGKTAIGQRSE